VEVHVLAKILESLDMMHRAVISDIQEDTILEAAVVNRMRYVLARSSVGSSDEALAGELARVAAAGGTDLPPAEDAAVRAFAARYRTHPLTGPLRRAMDSVQTAAEHSLDRDRLFATTQADRRPLLAAEQAVRTVLTVAAKSGTSRFVRNLAGVLLYYLALSKVLVSRKVRHLIGSVIPRRTEGGRIVRNRRVQIQSLIEKNSEYHRRYFALVKVMFPVVQGQVRRLVEAYGLDAVVLRTAEGAVNSNAYLKLLTNVLHDSLHAGLGVYVGFRYSAAGKAIEEGVRLLLKEIG
jgi:flagellar biosynthesis protein FlhG